MFTVENCTFWANKLLTQDVQKVLCEPSCCMDHKKQLLVSSGENDVGMEESNTSSGVNDINDVGI